MARTIGIGHQNFEILIANNNFYVDKTGFIREWWENDDVVTLITRPRRFGKTLLMNTVERFYSVEYEGKGAVFEGLDIWKEEPYRQLQGKLPFMGLNFADIKEGCFDEARRKICQILTDLYNRYSFFVE